MTPLDFVDKIESKVSQDSLLQKCFDENSNKASELCTKLGCKNLVAF